MGSAYDAAVARLNGRVMAAFGRTVVLVAPDGQRHVVAGDWRQEPLLIDSGMQGAVSTYQATIGIDLCAWPATAPRIEADWTGWRVEIPAASVAPDIPAGTWDIANVLRPGGAWIDIEITHHIPAP